MIRTARTFEGGLLTYHHNLVGNIARYRLQQASKDFLINNKFVTKSFANSFVFNYEDHEIKAEMRRFYKIILVNIRKKIPLLKAGNAEYEHPFIQIRMRYSSLDICIKCNPEVVRRYFRRIGVDNYLSKFNIHLSVDVIPQTLTSTNTPTMVEEVLIRFYPRTLTALCLPQNFYLVIFGIGKLVKILATLHRKSYFRETEVNNNVVTDDINIPF